MRMTASLLAALSFCAHVSPQSTSPVPALLQKLKSADAETRATAFDALAELGPAAHAAVPALAAYLTTFDEDERIPATLALGKIGKASIPAVEKLLDHEDETVRYHAVWVLGLIGPEARRLTPRLLKMGITTLMCASRRQMRSRAVHRGRWSCAIGSSAAWTTGKRRAPNGSRARNNCGAWTRTPSRP